MKRSHLLIRRCRNQETRSVKHHPGATVKDHPELVSNISRNCVNDQVEPECPASPGALHLSVPPAGFEQKGRTITSASVQLAAVYALT
jgi:hypothetical protein